ncbi:hypothetical protein [Thermocoleostomius sinensis]|uniref:Uncharacterized protein n=1 Tax=Thermocoleostomius sinensis A174 TaxID=2016057 RepID=A0A9E8ZHV7_9CYAN|nr:hypothetical protein [Thermocoleostomius sinensis]WAL62099.1 hypothetical protein OXH18_08965 [Thermocoleostomius sinensis A174]
MDFLIPIFNTIVIAVAVILLMVGLMSAPWPVLLSILAIGIWLSKWLIRQSQLQDTLDDLEGFDPAPFNPSQPLADADVEVSLPSSAESIDTTTLSYRGASYSPSQNRSATTAQDGENKDAPETVRSGKYRGGVWTA